MNVSSLTQLPRLLRTVRHLRPSQVGWRLRYLVQRRLEAQPWFWRNHQHLRRGDAPHAVVPAPHFLRKTAGAEPHSDRLTELQAGRLTLLNQTLPFAGGADWCLQGGRTEHRLWRYNLHYHGWLTELAESYASTSSPVYLEELRKWLVDWIATCRLGEPGFTHYPWNSYTIAGRLWQWRAIQALVPAAFWRDEQLPRELFASSVTAQANYLATHVEWDLRGNHLLKDAVGLASAADLIGGPSGCRWRELACDIAVSQLAEQILSDGMHFERSPMYHIHVLEDLLSLMELIPDDSLQTSLRETCRRMAEPLRWLRHPNGCFPLFNDAARSCVSTPEEMWQALVARQLVSSSAKPYGLKHFADAGLVAWHGYPWTLFFDVGAVGPDYQPGHAHADTLTLEASYKNVPLIVDPGTCCYDESPRRRYDRSTRAHNTVCIDDTDSSEVWQIFRVGRRAYPIDVSVLEREDGFMATASHTGYEHLPGQPRHRRQIVAGSQSVFEIHDEITGVGTHRAEGGFLLAPEWSAVESSTGWILTCGAHRLKVDVFPNQSLEWSIMECPWHPEYGKEVITQRLVWAGYMDLPFRVTTLWQPIA